MTPSAIRALREQVEAGKPYNPEDYDTITAAFGFNHHWQNMLVISAWVKGSLDAACAMQESVLPGWARAVDATDPEAGIEVTLYPPCCPLSDGYRGPCRGDDAIESRAHLIAILRALEEEWRSDG